MFICSLQITFWPLREAAKKFFFSGPATKRGVRGLTTKKKELFMRFKKKFHKKTISSKVGKRTPVIG